MKWYYYLLIAIGALLVIAAVAFLITYLVSKSNKNKREAELNGFYVRIIEAVGGKNNIVDVNSISSRLSIVLDNMDNINQEKLQELVNEGVGVVKANKKITLVIGDKASEYCLKIKEEIAK